MVKPTRKRKAQAGDIVESISKMKKTENMTVTKKPITSSDGKVFYPCQFCSKIFPIEATRNSHMKECANKEYILSVGETKDIPQKEVPKNVEPAKAVKKNNKVTRNIKVTRPKEVTNNNTIQLKETGKNKKQKNVSMKNQVTKAIEDVGNVQPNEDVKTNVMQPTDDLTNTKQTSKVKTTPKKKKAKPVEKENTTPPKNANPTDVTEAAQEEIEINQPIAETNNSVVETEKSVQNTEEPKKIPPNKKILIRNSITIKPATIYPKAVDSAREEGNVESTTATKEEDEDEIDPSRKCKVCHQIFDNPLDQLKHTRDCHTVRRRILPLDELEKYFDYPDKTFCPLCEKHIKTRNFRSVFIKHLMVHTSGMIHECSICSKRFRRKDHMRVHEKRHDLVVS